MLRSSDRTCAAMSRLAMYAGEGWCPTGRQWDLLMSLPSSEVPSVPHPFRFSALGAGRIHLCLYLVGSLIPRVSDLGARAHQEVPVRQGRQARSGGEAAAAARLLHRARGRVGDGTCHPALTDHFATPVLPNQPGTTLPHTYASAAGARVVQMCVGWRRLVASGMPSRRSRGHRRAGGDRAHQGGETVPHPCCRSVVETLHPKP